MVLLACGRLHFLRSRYLLLSPLAPLLLSPQLGAHMSALCLVENVAKGRVILSRHQLIFFATNSQSK